MPPIALQGRWRVLKSQRSRLIALLLSCSAHVGLGFAVGAGGIGEDDMRRDQAASLITAHLRTLEALPQNEVHSHSTKPDDLRDTEPQPKSERPLPVAQELFEEQPALPIASRLEPHYFFQSELTQKPILLHDAPADLLLAMPGLSSQALTLRLMINEHGFIDEVKVEASDLPPQTESVLLEAFSKIKFHPGKIGAAAVKSQMKIEVQLESTT